MTPEERELKRKRLRLLELKAKAAAAEAEVPGIGENEVIDPDPPAAMPVPDDDDRPMVMNIEQPEAGNPQATFGDKALALGYGVRSGPLFGLDDELGAALQTHPEFGARMGNALYPEAMTNWADRNGIGFQPTKDASGQPMSLGQFYREARDGNRAQKEAVRGQAPGWNLAGEVLGGMIVPGGQVKSLSSAMKLAGLLGLGAGFGNSDADLTRGEVGGATLDTLTGGGAGALLGPVGHYGGQAIAPLARKGRQLFENWGVNAARRVLNGGATLSNATKRPLSDEAARVALDDKAIGILGNTEGAKRRLNALTETVGDAYGAIVSDLEAQGVEGPAGESLAGILRARAGSIPTGANQSVPNLFRAEADHAAAVAARNPITQTFSPSNIYRKPPPARLGLKQAEEMKRALQREAKYGKYEDTPLNEGKQEIASVYRQSVEDVIDDAAERAGRDSDIAHLAAGFVPVKRHLGSLLEAEAAATKAVGMKQGRNAIGLTDAIIGSSAMPTSGPFGAMAVGYLSNLLRNRGTSTWARAAYGTSKGAKSLANWATLNPGKAPLLLMRPGSAYERAADAESQADGLTEKERTTLADLLRAIRGER